MKNHQAKVQIIDIIYRLVPHFGFFLVFFLEITNQHSLRFSLFYIKKILTFYNVHYCFIPIDQITVYHQSNNSLRMRQGRTVCFPVSLSPNPLWVMLAGMLLN